MAKKIKAKTLEETIKEHGEVKEVFGVQAEKAWQGQELQTKPSDPLIDPGQGKPYIIRQFLFGKNPSFKGHKPSNQDIFNMHWRQIRNTLWGDGLVPREDIEPKIVGIKDNKYMIILVCEPRLMTMVAEKPQTLQDILPSSG